MSSLKPLADRVLVKPDEAEQKTASGLYIASNAQEKPQRGTIVAVGAGKVNDKGERIHHILSPKTGKPVKGVQSVTIIGPPMDGHSIKAALLAAADTSPDMKRWST